MNPNIPSVELVKWTESHYLQPSRAVRLCETDVTDPAVSINVTIAVIQEVRTLLQLLVLSHKDTRRLRSSADAVGCNGG